MWAGGYITIIVSHCHSFNRHTHTHVLIERVEQNCIFCHLVEWGNRKKTAISRIELHYFLPILGPGMNVALFSLRSWANDSWRRPDRPTPRYGQIERFYGAWWMIFMPFNGVMNVPLWHKQWLEVLRNILQKSNHDWAQMNKYLTTKWLSIAEMSWPFEYNAVVICANI